MGMDVYGRNNPDAYFRNNVWWWRPLWEYCVDVAPELCANVAGHYNDGDGLDENDALALASILRAEIENGNTEKFRRAYYAELAKLPLHDCAYCDATGIRADSVGVDAGMPTKELDTATAVILGRTHGTCNACRGYGKLEDSATHYPFSVENVQEFADFLSDCGGFSIH